MKRTGFVVFSLVLATAGIACAPDDSGSSAQPPAAPGAALGADAGSIPELEAPPVASAAGAGQPVPAAAPSAEAVAEAVAPEPAPAEPFNVQVAAKVLDQPLERVAEAIDDRTTEYTLTGATSSAVIAQTQWSTAPEAEFECERAAVGAERIVGSDRMSARPACGSRKAPPARSSA